MVARNRFYLDRYKPGKRRLGRVRASRILNEWHVEEFDTATGASTVIKTSSAFTANVIDMCIAAAAALTRDARAAVRTTAATGSPVTISSPYSALTIAASIAVAVVFA